MSAPSSYQFHGGERVIGGEPPKLATITIGDGSDVCGCVGYVNQQTIAGATGAAESPTTTVPDNPRAEAPGGRRFVLALGRKDILVELLGSVDMT